MTPLASILLEFLTGVVLFKPLAMPRLPIWETISRDSLGRAPVIYSIAQWSPPFFSGEQPIDDSVGAGLNPILSGLHGGSVTEAPV
ncbi:uncharacterized protein N7506_007561 [Penicillium brevicompactum]|uniref:uncharacterized protein n=1 Tax=Penicillium brevicompactum TaxID=5074 RepID=UPI0025407FCD|nr:uncharacterized protein N7506_007561 [Penicillium brevicompactum]KAJ5333778.1 hypothetical protein N7506_007561 [Penicillium brevicompactum]